MVLGLVELDSRVFGLAFFDFTLHRCIVFVSLCELVFCLLELLNRADLFLQFGGWDLPALAHDVDDVLPEWQSVVKEDTLSACLHDFTCEVEVESFAFFGGDAEALTIFSITLDEELGGAIIDVD